MGILTGFDPRGLAPGARGLQHRITTPAPPLQEYPPFSVELLGFAGATAIPNALAYALKWQIEFAKLPNPPDERKQELADKLLAIWKFVVEQEVVSPRAPDGTLLIDDPWKRHGRLKGKVTFIEVGYNHYAPVAESESEPLDPWAPALFPHELPVETRRQYPVRLKKLEEIPPFFPDIVAQWLPARAYRPPPPKPPPSDQDKAIAADVADEIKRDPWRFRQMNDQLEEGPKDEEEVKAALAKAEQELIKKERESNRKDLARAQLEATSGPTPIVNRAIATLKKVTRKQIELQTQVRFNDEWADQPLYQSTEVILYHSVCSFVLNKDGEPFDLLGRLHYPILVPEPGSQMRRQCPPPGGVFVSVQKYEYQNFRIANGKIDKVLFGGVGGFEEYGYGYSGKHDFHKRIQSFIDAGGGNAFIAGVSSPATIDREEITVSQIRGRVPEFAEAVIPPLVKEVRARAKNKIENWQQFLKEAAEEFIRDTIVDAVKTRVRNYIIKKIGVRIVPGLNIAAGIYDLATGGTERMRMRHAIACIIVALKSRSNEDMTISAKVCAKIVADAFEEEIMEAIVNAAKKAVGHIAMKVRGSKAVADDGPDKSAEDPGQTRPAMKPGTADAPKTDSPTAPGLTGSTPVAVPKNQSPPESHNLSFNPRGQPEHSAPVATPRHQNNAPNTQAERAVAEMKKRIQDDLQRKAQQAVAQSTVKNDVGAQTAGDANKNSLKRPGTADTNATSAATATGDKAKDGTATSDRAKEATGTANTVSGNQQIRREIEGKTVDEWKREGAARKEAQKKKAAERKAKPKDDATESAPADPPPIKPIGGSGTLADPHRYPPGPEPVQITARPKDNDDDLPEGVSEIDTTSRRRTRETSHSRVLRAERERKRGLTPIDHDSHHVAEKAGGGRTGRRIRKLLDEAGVSIDSEANELAARGLPRDRRAIHESDSQHWGLHNERNRQALLKDLLKVRGKHDETEDVLRKHAERLREDRGIPDDSDIDVGPEIDDAFDDEDEDDDKPPKPPKPSKPQRGGGKGSKKKR